MMLFLHSLKMLVLNGYDRFKIAFRRRSRKRFNQYDIRDAVVPVAELDKEQKAELDAFFRENYGSTVPDSWHRYYSAFTGNFDKGYFPELIYIPEFEYFMNLFDDYAKSFEDKNITPLLAEAAGVRCPRNIVSCVKGVLRDEDNIFIGRDRAIEILADVGAAFCKPTVNSNSGRGCAALEITGGIDKLSGRSIGEIIDALGTDFVIQERLRCAKEIEEIYPGSVNSFRIITYRWKNNIHHTPAILRLGVGGSCVDNIHANGIFVGIKDDGSLLDMAYNDRIERFEKHPDTGFVFKGVRLSRFPEVLCAAEKMHQIMPQIGVINWDFTLCESGPVLIEANINSGSIDMCQKAHGRGPFGDDTAEILRWMGKMKKLPMSKREKFAFGLNFE